MGVPRDQLTFVIILLSSFLFVIDVERSDGRQAPPPTITRQADALLSFKNSSIDHDPSLTCTLDWGRSISDVCSWDGVVCSSSGDIVALELDGCGILGKLHFGDLMPLQLLRNISFSNNGFYESISTSNISSSPCSFQFVNLSFNFFQEVESTFLQPCRNLLTLDISHNNINTFPKLKIGNKLKSLYLSANIMDGYLPIFEIQEFSELEHLDLRWNRFSGFLDPTGLPGPAHRINLARCKGLKHLDLRFNNLRGSIPSSLFELPILENLDLSFNQIGGKIPNTICDNNSKLRFLNLSRNNISGPLPIEIGKCKRMEYLGIRFNYLSGSIPSTIFELPFLEWLDLSNNQLGGEIPQTIARNYSLDASFYMDLSHNHLHGMVPLWLIASPNYHSFDLSNNDDLCASSVAPCSPNIKEKLVIILPASAFLCLLILGMATIYFKRRRRVNTTVATLPIFEQYEQVSFSDLRKATCGFSSFNLLGSGSYAHVYMGIIDCFQTIVAIKVFKGQQGGSKSFLAECESLRRIRHRNIVKVLTSCSSIDYQENEFRALVFEYMPNGSLERWLHNGMSGFLSLLQRLSIAIDVACALEYLHHDCVPRVVHCDLKPSNILLDCDMTACVGDFGLARFLVHNNSSLSECHSISMRIQGTIGYIAPEYSMGSRPSVRGDIYSYGIVLLEMFTGKRPTNDTFEDGLSLHNYVNTALPDGVMNIVDPFLLSRRERQLLLTCREKVQDSLQTILEIGVKCSVDSPRARMKMKDVVAHLERIREGLRVPSI